MQRRSIWTSIAMVLLAVMAFGQAQPAQEDYLDVFTVQVKPEKRAEFDAIAKKIAIANRQNKGDEWVAVETVYGPGNRVSFISPRHSYADVEAGMGNFMQALGKTYGKGVDKMFQEFSDCIVSSQSEIRRRRWDLTSNPPSDPMAYSKLVGESRWLRTTVVHVRPGQVANFEALLKEIKTAREKASPPITVLVSQAVAGQEGTVFYVTGLQSSLAGFDKVPTLRQTLGEDEYQNFLKQSGEMVSGMEVAISRFLPDLSNAPEQIASAAPDYWRPKAAVAPVNAKKAPKSPVTNASEKTKMNQQ